MVIKCLGSGSKGNCFLLISKDEVLIIEAGVHLIKVKKALNFNISKVAGCIITHEHLDHAKYANNMRDLGINIYATKGTIDEISVISSKVKQVHYRIKQKIGSFSVTPYKVLHDAAEPCSFLIEHNELGRMLFITDTNSFNYSFENIDYLFIESNYDQNIIMENAVNNPDMFNMIDRLESSHMSLDKCISVCLNNMPSKAIFLMHLSRSNSNGYAFLGKVKNATGKLVFIADENGVFDTYW